MIMGNVSNHAQLEHVDVMMFGVRDRLKTGWSARSGWSEGQIKNRMVYTVGWNPVYFKMKEVKMLLAQRDGKRLPPNL